MVESELELEIKKIPGPILVLGASGFIGANLFHMLAAVRPDVFATATQLPAWRLEHGNQSQLIEVDLSSRQSTQRLLDKIMPATVFDCVAYGGYFFEKETDKIYQTNLVVKVELIEELIKRKVYCYIHAGSSSEYGVNASGPQEDIMLTPNSHYAVTKCAMSSLIYFAGKHQKFRCANLRLYSAYGPWEDSSRLVPTLVAHALESRLPSFVNADTSRDFIYVDDVCNAFVCAANNLTNEHYGESFNIGTGCKTTIRELAELIKKIYGIEENPVFASMQPRCWDTSDWYANQEKANSTIAWKAAITLQQGLQKTTEWFRQLADVSRYNEYSKQNISDKIYSISAIVACYKDELAIPIMVERLVAVFEKVKVDYEIILVNDGSPDASENIICNLSSKNSHVIGITHARNFGSQAAFRSGMYIASKNSCVLLDGDLQDPPELIEQFLMKWREGNDVVYGVRTKREASWFMQVAYKIFYRVFNLFSSIPIPNDAGDFSLIDRRVVAWLLACQERDLYLRGLRAFVGFKQCGVEYIRPERMFGETTNNFLMNIDWAKKGILSFSKTPLNVLTAAGILLTSFTVILAFMQIGAHIIAPQSAPKGITSLMLLVMFFGSFTIFSISLVGEYVAKIFEEVKARPHYIRKNIIKNGLISSCHEIP